MNKCIGCCCETFDNHNLIPPFFHDIRKVALGGQWLAVCRPAGMSWALWCSPIGGRLLPRPSAGLASKGQFSYANHCHVNEAMGFGR